MTETNQQELTDLIANTYASEFHDPAGHAARAILQWYAEALLTERNEALREAAEVAVSMTDNEPDGYYGQACYEVASAIRALAEGGAQ